MRTYACHDSRILVDENRRGESFEGATYRKIRGAIEFAELRRIRSVPTLDARHTFVANRAVKLALRENYGGTHVVEVRFLADRKANTHPRID